MALDPFAPLSREDLADLCREFLLAGHMIDRVAVPLLLEHVDSRAQTQVAIDEWMAASPIYSARMQRTLGFVGSDVGTVFKNIQLDIGAPPQFMDFQFRLDGPDYGEFWLAHCGALRDVEPWGEAGVRRMCHDIEDPTFDATAAATDPMMRIRPIHRPPREPAGRFPVCHWKVFIAADGEPAKGHPNLERVTSSLVASVPIEAADPDDHGGLADYGGPFDPAFQLEDLSRPALIAVAQEAAVQAHLLVRSFSLSVTDLVGAATARAIARRTWVGVAALTAGRLADLLRSWGDEVTVARVFALHPHFWPRTYCDLSVTESAAGVRVSVAPSPALEEGDAHSWPADLGSEPHPALVAIATAVEPRAEVAAGTADGADRWAWMVTVDPDREPAAPPPELALAEMSSGAAFEFVRRRRATPVALTPRQ